jgi:hypothetical protein
MEFLTFAWTSAIAVFIYQQQLSNDRLKDESVISSSLIKCFLRLFISYVVDYGLTLHFSKRKMLNFARNCRIITPATLFNSSSPSTDMLFFHWSREYQSNHHQRHFHARTHTQLEKLPSDSLVLATSNWIASVEKGLDGRGVVIMPVDGARRSRNWHKRQRCHEDEST